MLAIDSAQSRHACGTRISPQSRHYEMLALGFMVVPAECRSGEAHTIDMRQELSPWARPRVRPSSMELPQATALLRLALRRTFPGKYPVLSFVRHAYSVLEGERKDAIAVRCAA